MINESEPAGLGADKPGQGWNTDTPCAAGLSCNEVAKFMNAYMTGFRLFAISGEEGGMESQLKQISQLYEMLRSAAFDTGLTGQKKDDALNGLSLGIAAAGLAAISATSKIPTETCVAISNMAQEAALTLLAKDPKVIESGEIRFAVRKGPDGIEVGGVVVSYEDLTKQMESSELIKALKKAKNQGDN